MRAREAFNFGLIDGVNGAAGLVIGLVSADAAAAVIFVALLSRAGASGVSMAGAEFESDTSSSTRRERAIRVGAMWAGYVIAALAPGLGFAADRRAGLLVFVPTTILILLAVSWFRAGRVGWPRAILTTLAIFTLAIGAGFAAGAAG